MKSKAKKFDILSLPFRIEIGDIHKIWDKIDLEINRDISVTAVCRDNVSRRFDSKEELENFSNEKENKIIELDLYGRFVGNSAHKEMEISIRISLKENPSMSWNNVVLSVDGEDEERVQRLYRDLKRIVVSTSPWYKYFIKRTWTVLIINALFGVMLFEEINDTIARSPLGQINLGWSETTTNIYSTGWIAAIILWMIIVGHFVVDLWKSVFPIGKISIGKEKNREEVRERLRWLVVASVAGILFAAVREWIV